VFENRKIIAWDIRVCTACLTDRLNEGYDGLDTEHIWDETRNAFHILLGCLFGDLHISGRIMLN